MAVVEPRASYSIPTILAKFDCKQATFHIPIFLLPVTRQIFYKRYVCDIGQRVAYSTGWADFTRTNRRIEVADSGDLEPIACELPSNDLFKTRIRVTLGSAKAVTITVYYTTGTVLVQGNRCTSWVREEFSALMDTIRAMYILANHHTQPDLHKEVDEGLRLLPLPSPDSTSTQTTSAGDSGTRPPFVTALLAKVVLSPTPSVTGGCTPATPTSAVTTHPSPRPSHPSPTQPNGGQQETTNQRSDLETTKAKYSHTTPPFQRQHSATQSTSKKTHAKRSKPTKDMHIVRKQTTNPYSLTKKINTLAAAVRNISNVVCALQQQVCALRTENVTLKTVIRNLKNQSTSSSKPTPDCSSDPQVPAASKPASTRQTKKGEDLSEQQRARSSSKTPSTVYHQTTKTTQQRPETTNRPATSDLADSTSRRTAAAMPQRRATEDSRPAVTSGHANSTTRFTAASPRQRLAELRVAPGVTNVLIGDSVARPIKPDLVFPGGQSQNISVSGLAIDDVNHWLANIPRNREVRRVVIHIGVNTCKFAVVTESMWKQLIRKLRHVFPEAAVLVSSIVPPMGRLRKTVQVSNAALLAVCNREKVSVVNHTDAFTARSGAPRKHLYRDQLHPSDGGTSRMVFNLQLATGALRRQVHHHLASTHPQHRQDPAQPQQRQKGIKQHHAARPSLLGPAPPGFVSYAQHQWLAYWNSRQRQRTTVPQQCETDLFRSAYHVRRNTAVNSPRPPTPPVYHHCVPRDLYPRETLA